MNVAAKSRVDLEELTVRENEQTEWKENVADELDVVRTLSAFANDLANLGGGYVVCGAREQKDADGHPTIVRLGLEADRLAAVKGKVLDLCQRNVSPPLAPLTDEQDAGSGRRVLVFIQPATSSAHTCRDRQEGTRYWVRLGSTTREARNGILRDLLVRKGAVEPWDHRICQDATANDLDLLALRDALQRMRIFSPDLGIEPFLTEERALSPFVPSLCGREKLTGAMRPRNFALLLFGRETQRFVPGAYSIFSIYPGDNRSDPHSERLEIAGTLIDQARQVGHLLDSQSFTTFDKTVLDAPNAVTYPKRALYEAMGNGLAHRDYEAHDPFRITVFSDRIEMLSPGSLPRGVDAVEFSEGRAGPRWRNQALAWFFSRLQLAQAEGQGIPTIIRSMREEGCPPPTLRASDMTVLCVLPAHPRKMLLRSLSAIEQSIALGDLPRAADQLQAILQRDPLHYRALQLAAEVQQALRAPEPLFRHLSANRERLTNLPPPVLVQLSEALVSSARPDEAYRHLSRELLTIASRGRLEERELRRIGVALLRARDEQGVMTLLEQQLIDHPEWNDTASLHQLRGDALLGLAKRCRRTAERPELARETRRRTWKQFTDYLENAERELHQARSLSMDTGLTQVINKNLQFLAKLKTENASRRSR